LTRRRSSKGVRVFYERLANKCPSWKVEYGRWVKEG